MANDILSPLRLALIGMSGAGKTFWTKCLAAAGHATISCDERIEQRLRSRLGDKFTGINGVAAWMGWPDAATYEQRESQYLSEEIATLDDVLTTLEQQPKQELILDTTGSVIYVGNHLLRRLRRQMTVVYLAASSNEQQLLVERYLTDPKPVLWRGAFQPRQGEQPRDTVARCYALLMETRRLSYEALAHCAVPVGELRDASMDAAGFLSKILSQLERAR